MVENVGLMWVILWPAIAAALSPVSVSWNMRNLDLQNSGNAEIALFSVQFDSDVYISVDGSAPRPISNFTGGTLKTVQSNNNNNVNQPQQQQQTVFVPNLLNLGGVAKLSCAGREFQSAGNWDGNGPPFYLVPAPPTSDPAASFMTLLGAFSLPETWNNNSVAFFLITDGWFANSNNTQQQNNGGFNQPPPQPTVNIPVETLQSCNAQLVFPGDTGNARLTDQDGNAYTGQVSIGQESRLLCTYDGVQKLVDFAAAFIAATEGASTSEQLNQMQSSQGAFYVREAWSACQWKFGSLIQQQQVTNTITVPGHSGCIAAYGSAAYATNPCCNRTLLDTMCCFDEPLANPALAPPVPDQTAEVTFWQLQSVNTQQLQQMCRHPDQMAFYVQDYGRIQGQQQDAMLASQVNNQAQSNPWQQYMAFWQTCQQALFSQACSLDSDCVYTNQCNQQSGTCFVMPDQQDDAFAQCILDNMDPDMNRELARIWGIGTFPTPDERVRAFADAFKANTYSYNCVGPRSQEYQSSWTAGLDAYGNYVTVEVPANKTGCLAVDGCNWNEWENVSPDECNGTTVKEVLTPYFCGIEQFDGTFQDVSRQPVCAVLVPWNPSSNQWSACPTDDGIVDTSSLSGFITNTPCVRPALNTLQSCLSSPLCTAQRNALNASILAGTYSPQTSGELWDWRCSQSSCYADPTQVASWDACSELQSKLAASDNSVVRQLGMSTWWNPPDTAPGGNPGACIASLWAFPQSAQNATLCALANLTWNEPRSFQPGQWATADQCALGQCSIQQYSYYGVTASQCASHFYCTQPCERCATWNLNNDGSEQTLCYSNQTQSQCASPGNWNTYQLPTGVQWAACVFPYAQSQCAAANLTFAQCDDLSQLQCPYWTWSQSGASTQVVPPGVGSAHLALGCQWNDHIDCRTTQECVAQGSCNDYDLQDCTYYMNAPPDCAAGLCIQQWQVDQGGNRVWCGQIGGTTRQTSLGCADTTVTSAQACARKGSSWSWHTRSTNASTCLGQGSQCLTQYQPSDRASPQCEDCGGQVQTVYRWTAGKALSGEQVSLTWGTRAWGPVNQWKYTLDMGKLQSQLQAALGAILARQMINRMTSQVFSILPVMRILACDCGDDDSANGVDCLQVASVTDSYCRGDAGLAAVCDGILGTMRLTNQTVATANGTSVILVPQTVTIGSAIVAAHLAALNITINQQIQATQGVMSIQARFDGHGVGQFGRSIAEHQAGAPTRWRQHWEALQSQAQYPWFKPRSLGVAVASQPYAVVPNRLGTGICGQIISSGYVVPSGSGLSFPMQICVSQSLDIAVDPSFPIRDFSNATSANPNVAGPPLNATVTQSGVSYCTDISGPGTFWLIARVADFTNGSVTFDPAPTTSPAWYDVFYNSGAFVPVMVIVVLLVIALVAFLCIRLCPCCAGARAVCCSCCLSASAAGGGGAAAPKQCQPEPYALQALHASISP